jgi:hypothetical protein
LTLCSPPFLQRTVADILLREQLDAWAARYGPEVFQVVYCVGSRWDNVHWGAKTKGKEYAPPPPPKGFSELKLAELVSYCRYLVLPSHMALSDYLSCLHTGLGERGEGMEVRLRARSRYARAGVRPAGRV